jgi:hypothetical protein
MADNGDRVLADVRQMADEWHGLNPDHRKLCDEDCQWIAAFVVRNRDTAHPSHRLRGLAQALSSATAA